jgi:UDP-glucose 4-epimerase
MPERVLVTGGAGFIGAPLVRELLRRGSRVSVLDDFSVGRRERLPGGAYALSADLRVPNATRAVVREAAPDSVAHLAAAHFIPWCVAHPDETWARNVDGTRNLLDALAQEGCERLVFVSTGDVYAPSDRPHREDDPLGPLNAYGKTKLEGEMLVRARLPGALVARLFNVYGPGETNPHVLPEILRQLREGDELRLGNTEAVREWIHLDDAVAAIASLLAAPGGETLNVSSGDARSVDELVELIASLTGRRLRLTVDPDRLRPVDRHVMRADLNRMQSVLPGLAPRSVEEGLAATLRAEALL